jgi:hypothetical protein
LDELFGLDYVSHGKKPKRGSFANYGAINVEKTKTPPSYFLWLVFTVPTVGRLAGGILALAAC